MRIADLEKRAALQILVYLGKKSEHEEPRATVTELRKNIKAALDSIYTALEVLQKLGLVERETEQSFPFATYYKLTTFGYMAAGLLVDLEKLLAKAEAEKGGEEE